MREVQGGRLAGGRTCPRTGAALPGQVRLRDAPELQRRIHAWAAQHGLEVPAVPAGGGALAAKEGGPASRRGLLPSVRSCLKRLYGRMKRAFAEAPVLYPDLAEENWARRA